MYASTLYGRLIVKEIVVIYAWMNLELGLRTEMGKQFQNEVAPMVKVSKEAVLWKEMYQFIGWDLMFRECREEHGVYRLRV